MQVIEWVNRPWQSGRTRIARSGLILGLALAALAMQVARVGAAPSSLTIRTTPGSEQSTTSLHIAGEAVPGGEPAPWPAIEQPAPPVEMPSAFPAPQPRNEAAPPTMPVEPGRLDAPVAPRAILPAITAAFDHDKMFRDALTLTPDELERRHFSHPALRDSAVRPAQALEPRTLPKSDGPTVSLVSNRRRLQDEGGGGEGRTYGRAPTSDTMQFLRRESVLLSAGDLQADVGLVYTLFEQDPPALVTDPNGQITGVALQRIRQRLLYVPFALRYGVTPRAQLFGFMPVGYSNTQTSASLVDYNVDNSNGGLGDITAGGNFLVRQGCGGHSPDIITNVYFTAPSGNFNAPIFGLVPGAALGQGFWAVGADALLINRYDPIIVFYGAGYRHLFARNVAGQPFQPGEQFLYQLGVGFAINERVTLSTAFQGFYITQSLVNNQQIGGSNLEPLTLRFAATIARGKRIVEPFALIGMTNQAPQAQLGAIITFR